MLNKVNFNIGLKLIWVSLFCTVPVLIIVGIILAGQQKLLLENSVNASLDNTLNFAKDAINQDFYHLKNEARSIATDPKLRRALDVASSRGISSRLNYIAKIRPEINYVLLIDNTESIFSATTSNYANEAMGSEVLLGRTISSHPLFANVFEKEASISAPAKDPFLSELSLPLGYSQWIIAPVIVRGKTNGWIVLSYKFEQTMAEFLQKLVDRLQNLNYAALSSSIINQQQQVIATTSKQQPNSLTRQIKITLGNAEFKLLVNFDQKQVLMPLEQQQQTTFIAFTLLILTLSLTLFLAVKKILIAPLNTLNTTVLKFSAGELSYRVPISGSDELNVLGQTFNTMATQIASTHEYLETQVEFRTKELSSAAKQLENKNTALKKYTHELERSNKELNDFAYVASHDLKAPLRGIVQLINWIEEDIEDSLEEQTKEYIVLMHSRINRLEKLLDDLLAYSRVGRLHGDFNKVAFKSFITDIFQLLEPPENFNLVYQGDIQAFYTLSVPLEQVLRNLINNAIKHHNKKQGTITVSAELTGNCYSFSVIDDGPGIVPEQHQRIFEIFQTLKPRDEVEGSGMGLAIIKKLLETYNQKVKVNSDGLTGTTMQFYWPHEKTLRKLINE